MVDTLSGLWPWYVAGPLIGLVVPLLLLIGNKPFGISSNLRHLCAAVFPARAEFFRYDWRRAGLWNLAFALGIAAGAAVGQWLLGPPSVEIAEATRRDLAGLGVLSSGALVPTEIFRWSALLSPRGLILILGGGFLVGFGTAYAGGCTSGHAITGLADFQLPSLIAVVAFFAGGLFATWLLLPLLLPGSTG